MKWTKRVLLVVAVFWITGPGGQSAVRLDALGRYLTQNGYGGAQLVHPGNLYLLPFQSNTQPGNFIVDTGTPTTMVFRASLKHLGLSEIATRLQISGAFGKSPERYGLTTITTLKTGNCTFTNVPVAVASDRAQIPFSRLHSNGLFGLRELIKFGAVLDLSNRIVYLRPSRPENQVSLGIGSILGRDGYTAVPLSLTDRHLQAIGAIDGLPCSFVIDTGAYVTVLTADFADRARLSVQSTRLMGESLGVRTHIGIANFRSLRIGNYEIRNGSASIAQLDTRHFKTTSGLAGILGVEYLATNSAVFDFVGRKVYLRPRVRRQ